MNKNLHDIDDLFRNSIDGHAEEVPPEIWKNIDHSLDKRQVAFYKRKYFTVRAAAILLLLIGGVTIAAILHYRTSETQSNNAVVVTGNHGNNLMTDQKQEGGKAGVEYDGVEKSVMSDEGAVDGAPENDSVGNKENSKAYQNIENTIYSAEKNQEVPVKAGAGIIKQNAGVRIWQVNVIPTLEMRKHQRQMNNESAFPIVPDADDAEAVAKLPRTRYIGDNLINIARFEIKNSITVANVTSSIVPDFTTPSASTRPAKSKSNSDSWLFSSAYAKNINLNTLRDNEQFRDPRNNSREVKRTEQETKSFTTGIMVKKELAGNVVLQTGIQYFSSKTTITPKMIFAEPDGQGGVRYRFNCSSGNSYIPTNNGTSPAIGDSVKTNSSKSALSYLQVPWLASYKIELGRLSILPSFGIQGNFLLSSELTSSLARPSGNEKVSSSINGLRSVYLSGVLQQQFSYKLNERISFDINPALNFSLSPINKGTAVKTFQNMASLGAGVGIKL